MKNVLFINKTWEKYIQHKVCLKKENICDNSRLSLGFALLNEKE